MGELDGLAVARIVLAQEGAEVSSPLERVKRPPPCACGVWHHLCPPDLRICKEGFGDRRSAAHLTLQYGQQDGDDQLWVILA